MKFLRLLSLLCVCLLGIAGMAHASPETLLTFRFERPGLPVPLFFFKVHPDGSASYSATVVDTPTGDARYAAYAQTPAARAQVEREITISPQTLSQMFEQVRGGGHFHRCESKLKNIANTGAKTFTYTGPDGEGSCTYNYTENKPVAALTDTFLGIAFTLDEGRKLERAHRFDRLGLDQEMSLLVEAVHSGRALELGNISSILNSIVNDPQVLERVRNRAATLLAGIPAAK